MINCVRYSCCIYSWSISPIPFKNRRMLEDSRLGNSPSSIFAPGCKILELHPPPHKITFGLSIYGYPSAVLKPSMYHLISLLLSFKMVSLSHSLLTLSFVVNRFTKLNFLCKSSQGMS